MFSLFTTKQRSVDSYTLRITAKNAICTYIPKNACKTLRYSVAVANGHPDSDETVDYMHQGMHDAMASANDIANCSYAFVILRCPYRRIVSAFLNKAAIKNSRARSLFPRGSRLFRAKSGSAKGEAHAKSVEAKINALTFGDFMTLLQARPLNRIDVHFRPQSYFLMKQRYTDVFALETLEDALPQLRDKIDLRIIEQRQNAMSKLEKLNVDGSKLTIAELIDFKAAGFGPTYGSLFNADSRRAVETFYADDLALYKSHFGSKNLLFPD